MISWPFTCAEMYPLRLRRAARASLRAWASSVGSIELSEAPRYRSQAPMQARISSIWVMRPLWRPSRKMPQLSGVPGTLSLRYANPVVPHW